MSDTVPEPAGAQLASDAPISLVSEDRLGRTKLARRIAKEAVTAPPDTGFVIGLCGEWGSGKSSTANLVEIELADDPRAVVVRFEPWLFSGTGDLLGLFFSILAAKLGKEERLNNVVKQFGEYASVLSNVAGFIPVVGGTISSVAGAAGAVAGKAAKPESLEKRRDKLASGLRQFDGRLVVIIDDIDRLADAEVIEIVRLAKLVGDLPRMTYVLCFDRARVEDVLGGGPAPETRQRGRAYMEKIVQSRFDLPPARPQMLSEMLADQANPLLASYTLPPMPEDDWANLLNFGIRPLLRVPRDAKRFANALPAAVELVNGEVALIDLLGLEAIRIFEPDVHAAFLLAEALTGLHHSLISMLRGDQIQNGQILGVPVPSKARSVQYALASGARLQPPHDYDYRPPPSPKAAKSPVTQEIEEVLARMLSMRRHREPREGLQPATLDKLEKLVRLGVVDHDDGVYRISRIAAYSSFLKGHERPSQFANIGISVASHGTN